MTGPRKNTDPAREAPPKVPPQPSWMTDGSLNRPQPNPSPSARLGNWLFGWLMKPWNG